MSEDAEIRVLEPNETGHTDIKITIEDRKLGYMLIQDWNGTKHRFELRKSEDYLSFPVPKIVKPAK
jgi:hypothetical protein